VVSKGGQGLTAMEDHLFTIVEERLKADGADQHNWSLFVSRAFARALAPARFAPAGQLRCRAIDSGCERSKRRPPARCTHYPWLRLGPRV
jgi:hypothetical protein